MATSLLYGRILEPETLVLFDKQSVSYAQLPWGTGSSEIFYLAPIALPEENDAKKWWEDLWGAEIVDFWIFRDAPFIVLCISKDAVWEALPDLHLKNQKARFQRLTEEEFRDLAGTMLTDAMVREQCEFGISVRRVLLRN